MQSGKSYGSIVGYVADGIFQNQEEVDKSGQPNARVGGLKYKDLDGKMVLLQMTRLGFSTLCQPSPMV